MRRKHELDQYFLRDIRTVAMLIGHTKLKKRDTVYDLGAGSGVISAALAPRVMKVIAVESDSETHRRLAQNMRRHANVETVRGDMMKYRFPAEGDYHIFANIPFSYSAAFVDRLTSLANPPKSIYLIVQRQFARKLLAGGTHFTSQLGMRITPWWRARIRKPLKKTDFWPHPAVDTVLLELLPRTEPLLEMKQRTDFERFVSRCYEDPGYFRSLGVGAPASRVDAGEMVRFFVDH